MKQKGKKAAGKAVKKLKASAKHAKKPAKKAAKKTLIRKKAKPTLKKGKPIRKPAARHAKKPAKKGIAKHAKKPAEKKEEYVYEKQPRTAEIINIQGPTPVAMESRRQEGQTEHHIPYPRRPENPESDETVKKCPECGGSDLIRDYERGEIICRTCGLVITDALTDFGPEWRAFDSEQKDKRARTGGPTKLMRPNKGLVTEIDQYNKDIRGAKIDTRLQAQLHRMRKWHKRISIASSFEKNLAIALGELDRVASSLGLPDNIKENIAALYRKAVKSELIRGRLIESVVAAVIYAACRIYGIPRTLDEISKISGVEKKEIGRAYRFLKKELELDIPLTDPSAYVPKFAVVLNLSRDVQMMAIEIIKKSLKKGLISGRGPTGVAAASLYIAAAMKNEKRTQKEVADVAGVTEVTIRNRYRELKRELEIDINL
jgi:transcription initiation factor TFIIB